MILALAGDVHGALEEVYRRLQAWESRTGEGVRLLLQAGDLDLPEGHPYLQQTVPCATWFVHGNHEDFALLERAAGEPLDPAGRLRCLEDGAIHRFEELRIAALGGIQPRRAKRPELPRYIQPAEVERLLSHPPGSADLLLAHDGPIGRCLARVRSAGSVAVYDAVKHLRPRYLFFGHYDDPVPPFDLYGCRCVCLNLPGPGRLPGRDGSVALLRTGDWSLAWLDAEGREHGRS